MHYEWEWIGLADGFGWEIVIRFKYWLVFSFCLKREK